MQSIRSSMLSCTLSFQKSQSEQTQLIIVLPFHEENPCQFFERSKAFFWHRILKQISPVCLIYCVSWSRWCRQTLCWTWVRKAGLPVKSPSIVFTQWANGRAETNSGMNLRPMLFESHHPSSSLGLWKISTYEPWVWSLRLTQSKRQIHLFFYSFYYCCKW